MSVTAQYFIFKVRSKQRSNLQHELIVVAVTKTFSSVWQRAPTASLPADSGLRIPSHFSLKHYVLTCWWQRNKMQNLCFKKSNSEIILSNVVVNSVGSPWKLRQGDKTEKKANIVWVLSPSVLIYNSSRLKKPKFCAVKVTALTSPVWKYRLYATVLHVSELNCYQKFTHHLISCFSSPFHHTSVCVICSF